ncbi:Hypothetical predicted protein [Paramuricea clavata]|nr:Hypothetical predicted protein [Paramuricea clavata]
MISSSHFNKIFLTLAIALTFSAIGSALMCNVCSYTSAQPKAQQMCGNNTVNCATGYCFSSTYTTDTDLVVTVRSCDDPNDRSCPDADDTCEKRTSKFNLKSCAGMCCTTDNCNNYTPSSATGIMVAKFSLCVMVIVGFFLA